MPINKGQRRRQGCGCFAPKCDFHARCAKHWECSFYSPGFELFTVRCAVCVLWEPDHWTALSKTRTYRSRHSKKKSVIMSSPGSKPGSKAAGKSVSKTVPALSPKKKNLKTSRTATLKPAASVSECIDSDSNALSDSDAQPVRKSRKLSNIPDVQNPIPVTTHVDDVAPALLLSQTQMLQLCEFMESQTVVPVTILSSTTSGVVQGYSG
jgi:hypothetical protein